MARILKLKTLEFPDCITMKEEILDQVAELKGRRTTMEIRNVRFGDKMFKREIVHRPDAVCAIVKVIAQENRYIFVKQFRVPVGQEMLEAVAGCVDFGEKPETAILREIEEETGYRSYSFMHLASVKASPGYSDETIHLFSVNVDPKAGKKHPDDDERLDIVQLTQAEVEKMISEGKFTDAKTLLAWYEFKRQEWL